MDTDFGMQDIPENGILLAADDIKTSAVLMDPAYSFLNGSRAMICMGPLTCLAIMDDGYRNRFVGML
jgi:hypothetical protein